MKPARAALVVGVLAVGAFLAWASLGGGEGTAAPPAATAPPAVVAAAAPGPAGDAQAFSHPDQCRACHPEAFEEWSVSMHARAVSDPEVRALSADFRSVECMSCHMPQPIHSAPVGGRVFERSGRFETAIDCLSCHLLPDGGVAATRDVPGAPCRPTKVSTLRDALTCKGCHNQHGLVDEMETLFRDPDPARGALLARGRPETCVDCHMPPVARQPGPDGAQRLGANHVFPGGHYEEVLRRGATLEARIEDGAVVAEVANSGTGHRIPSDSRHRSLNVWVTVTTEAGVKVQDRTEIWEGRMYYRSPPRENTNLRPGETATARLALPRGLRGKVLVELVYAMNLIKKERREAKMVHAVELDFDTAK